MFGGTVRLVGQDRVPAGSVLRDTHGGRWGTRKTDLTSGWLWKNLPSTCQFFSL